MTQIDPSTLDARAFAAREMTWSIPREEGDLGVAVRAPGGPGPFPVLFLFHHGPGLDDGTRAVMSLFANNGYFVVAPDRYYRQAPWMHFSVGELLDPNSDGSLMQQLLGVMEEATDERMSADVAAILARLADEPLAQGGAFGCIGFCVGARTVIKTLAEYPDRAVAGAVFHPSNCVDPGPDSPHLAVPSIRGKLYASMSVADPVASPEANAALVEVMGELGDRATLQVFENANHGFAVPGAGYDREAAMGSYQGALELFGREL